MISRTPSDAPPGALSIQLNGQALHVPVGTDLEALLAREVTTVDPKRCATAVNGRFVPRTARRDTPLNDGDAVTTFQAIVGG